MELAKQGDVRAIAALMNRPLQAKGITADVSAEGDRLDVRLEGQETPNQTALVQFVHKGLSNLNIPVFNRVNLSGYQKGSSTPAWEQELPLQDVPDFLDTPTPVPPVPPTRVEEEDDYAADDASSAAYRAQDALLDYDSDYASDYVDDLDLVDETSAASPVAPDEDSEDESQTSQLLALFRSPMAMIGAIAILLVLLGGLAYRFFLAPRTIQPEAANVPTEPAPGAASPSPEAEATPDIAAPETTEPDAAPLEGAEATADPEDTPEAEVPDTETPGEDTPAAEAPADDAPAGQPEATAEPAPSPEASPATDPFREAVNKATEAANLTQTANTAEQWQQIATLWQEASDLMAEVPEDNPNYATAQDRVGTYRNNAAYAQQQAQ
jgi:hypothetical protein